LQRFLVMRGAESLGSCIPNPWLSARVAPVAPGRCDMRRAWAVPGLLPLHGLTRSPRVVASGWLLRAAASGREAGGGGAAHNHLPLRQRRDLCDTAVVQIPRCWEEEGGEGL